MAKSSFSDRERAVLEAKLAGKARLYDVTIKAMDKVIKEVRKGDLTVEERKFLEGGYEGVIQPLRDSLKVLAEINRNKRSEWDSIDHRLWTDYTNRVVKEIKDTCNKVLRIIDELIPRSSTLEAEVFYHKMKGDYNMYRAQISYLEKENYVDMALEAYGAATAIAVKELPCANLLRLSLSLNHSICYSEIVQDNSMASAIAKSAYDKAVAELESYDNKEDKQIYLFLERLLVMSKKDK